MATLIGCRFDELRQREHERRQRQITGLAAAAAFIAVLLAGLAGFAFWQWSDAIAQKKTADEQKLEAQKQKQQAFDFFDVAIDQLATSQTALGYTKLTHDPAAAARLALTAREFAQSRGPSQLFQRALESTPRWAEVGERNENDCRGELNYPEISGLGCGRNRPDLTVVVGVDSPGEGSGAEASLVLRSVPNGEILARRPTRRGERFITPEQLTTKLFTTVTSVGSRNIVAIYGVSAAEFDNPLLSVGGAKDVAFSDGHWPVYTLMEDGQVVIYYLAKRRVQCYIRWNKGTSSIRQYSSSSGKEISKFADPERGWPAVIAQIAGAF